MGLSSVVAYPDISARVRKESNYRGPASQRPAEDDPLPNELVAHIVRVHHVTVRRSLTDLMSSLPATLLLSTAREGKWYKLVQQFGELHDAILMGIGHEESLVFPLFVDWQAEGKQQSPPSELLVAAKSVERLHACCLQMFWRFLRQFRDQLNSQPTNGQHLRRVEPQAAKTLEQLAAACDDYEQYLFDVECILLPIVTAASRLSCTSAMPQPHSPA